MNLEMALDSEGCPGQDGSKTREDATGRARTIVRYPRKAKSRKSKPKARSRKSLVKAADAAFSRHIRDRDPFSFFSGKPTECCFHIITRSKFAVRWDPDNAVGSTMAENFENEFNPHKFLAPLIHKRGLPWYEALVRRSNEIRKWTRADLEEIAARGYSCAL